MTRERMDRMKTYSITDTGALREMNQDYFFASDDPVGNLPNLYIVADGMGGHKAGDYASRYTTQRMVASVSRSPGEEPVTILQEAITTANKLLRPSVVWEQHLLLLRFWMENFMLPISETADSM